MSVRCDIEIPEKIIKTLGLKENEVGTVLRKELAAFFFKKTSLHHENG